MRKFFRAFALAVVVLTALTSPLTAAPQAAEASPASVTFRHRTAEGVLFEMRIEENGRGAAYAAFLAEGEHITERSGSLTAERWKALVASVAPLAGKDTAREVSSSDACYEVTVTRGGTTHTARFTTPVNDRERAIVHCFDPKALPGRVYASLTSGIQSH